MKYHGHFHSLTCGLDFETQWQNHNPTSVDPICNSSRWAMRIVDHDTIRSFRMERITTSTSETDVGTHGSHIRFYSQISSQLTKFGWLRHVGKPRKETKHRTLDGIAVLGKGRKQTDRGREQNTRTQGGSEWAGCSTTALGKCRPKKGNSCSRNMKFFYIISFTEFTNFREREFVHLYSSSSFILSFISSFIFSVKNFIERYL